jgi:hypothetical protein
VRLLRNLGFFLSDDDAGEKPLFGPIAEARSEVSTGATPYFSKENHGVLKIAAAGSKALPFGDVLTAKTLLILSDKALNVTLNGGAQVIALDAPASGRGLAYWEGSFISASLANPGATEATVLYAVTGG